MKKIFFSIFVLFGFASQAFADLSLILDDEINFKSKKGVVNGKIAFGNVAFQGIGNFTVDKNNKATIKVDRLMNNGKIYSLKNIPKFTKVLKNKKIKLPKGTTITLKGEKQEEMKELASKAAKDAKDTEASANTSKKSSSKSSGSSSSSSGSSGGSLGSNNSSGTSYLPYSTTTSTSSDGDTTTYSSVYCTVPEYLDDNSVKLSIIDSDGTCVTKYAYRNDDTCGYRYDFDNMVAIKQTQYYYIDNNNETQTVGDCVDLNGDNYTFTMYYDDSKCSLETTEKDYNGGSSTFYLTQILFRGMDGFIYEATDCITFANVYEELVQYEHDYTNKTSQRRINQYYIDPLTDEKIYITKNVLGAKSYSWTESVCGDWEMDDTNLYGRKRTKLWFFDDVDYEEVNMTSCDFGITYGKSSEYRIDYQLVDSDIGEKTLSTTQQSFSFTKYTFESVNCCDSWYQIGNCYRNKANGTTSSWTTQYEVIQVSNSYVYIRPDSTYYYKPVDTSIAKSLYYKYTKRTELISSDSIGLGEYYRTAYEISKDAFSPYITNIMEVNGEQIEYLTWDYSLNITEDDYAEFVSSKIGSGNVTCIGYTGYGGGSCSKSTTSASCTSYTNYNLSRWTPSSK